MDPSELLLPEVCELWVYTHFKMLRHLCSLDISNWWIRLKRFTKLTDLSLAVGKLVGCWVGGLGEGGGIPLALKYILFSLGFGENKFHRRISGKDNFHDVNLPPSLPHSLFVSLSFCPSLFSLYFHIFFSLPFSLPSSKFYQNYILLEKIYVNKFSCCIYWLLFFF